MARGCDILIIGAGIAGASAAYRLAPDAEVILLEGEAQPGYHSTGRSAAMFVENYGNAAIQALSAVGREFFHQPPDGFTEVPLLAPRGTLAIADHKQLEKLDELIGGADVIERLTPEAVVARVPILRRDGIAAGALAQRDSSIDVNALHQGFLRGFAARRGERIDRARVTALSRDGRHWRVTTTAGGFEAPVVVNAAGAWADEVAALAGLAKVGLQPMRRTAFVVDTPRGLDASGWPLVFEITESFYFRPESGGLLLSPANEDPMPPCDVRPEDLDIAIAIDRFEQATGESNVRPRRDSPWAGLRTFAPDRTPVVGWEPAGEGFFWLAGQGGYGIQTSPAMAATAREMIIARSFPQALENRGLDAGQLSPARFAGA